jgi:hypothetical protein
MGVCCRWPQVLDDVDAIIQYSIITKAMEAVVAAVWISRF